MEEIWKDIKGFEGMYQVSNLGRARSLDRVIKGRLYKGRILKGSFSGRYISITLSYKGGEIQRTLHRLIAETFIPNPEKKPCIDHIDTNRLNNNINNLRWVTHKENSNNILTIQHLSDSQKGLPKKGYPCTEQKKKNIALAKSRPVCCLDKKGKEVARFNLIKDAAIFANVSIFAIYHNLQGASKSAGGYRWQLVNNN